jgi:DegV family protein with EDD domain
LFFEGFVEGALGRATAAADSLRSTPAPAPADTTGGLVATGEIVAFRFCTECTLLAPSIDRRRLHDELSRLGTSLVLAGRRNKMRIHIHTNEPSGVFAAARRHGTVADEKADDMLRQSQTHTMRTVAVVTDSGADLPEEVCEQLGIHVVPLRIHFADRTFLDKITLTNEGFMREVAASDDHPRTSQPAPGDLRRVYEYLASHHPHVVAISLDAQVSGTWQAARTAARRSSAPERITVIDSRNASIGQGLIAAYAAECARAGLPLAELLEAVRRAVGATRSFAVVDDLSWAVRGGRLPAALGALTRILPIRPVLGMGNGAVRISGVMRRGADPVAMLLRQLTRQLAPGERYRFAVAHFDMAEAAARLGSALRERLADHAGVFVSELGAAASVHSGPRTIAAAVQAYRAPTASQ